MSGIFYAANTEYRIDYVDCLFLCVSAMTVTGLATNNLSQLTGFQQALLFVQMIMGNIITISLVMIMVRQYFFRQEFRHIIEARRQAEVEAAKRDGGVQSPLQKLRRLSQSFAHPVPPPPPPPVQNPPTKLRWTDLFRHSAPPTAENTPRHSLDETRPAAPRSDDSHPSSPSSVEKAHREGHAELGTPKRPPPPDRQGSAGKKKKGKGWKGTKLRTDMIQRVEGGGVGLVNPMGWYHSPMDVAPPLPPPPPSSESYELDDAPTGIMQVTEPTGDDYLVESPTAMSRVQSTEAPDPAPDRRASEPAHDSAPVAPAEEKFPRTKTIAFDDNLEREKPQRGSVAAVGSAPAAPRDYVYPSYARTTGYLPRTGTIRSANAGGGLPMPKSESRTV